MTWLLNSELDIWHGVRGHEPSLCAQWERGSHGGWERSRGWGTDLENHSVYFVFQSCRTSWAWLPASPSMICDSSQDSTPQDQGERKLGSVQSLSRVWLFATPWITACQTSMSITNSRTLLKLMSIELVMPSNHLILCRPLLLLPPIPPSIRVFSNESTLHIRWSKYWSFSFSISPSNEHSGLISFRMDWLDLLAVQGTVKGLFQHHSSKASILRHSASFTV